MNAIGTGSIKDYASHLRSHFENALLDQTRSPHANAGLALIIFASALAARFALDMFVPDRAPYITFFPAVLLSAVFCGLWPTIAVAAASGISGTFWLHAPEGSSLNYRLAGMLVFAFSAALSLFLAESLRNALAGLRERDRHLQLLNDELSHRMRNLFQLANAIVSQSLRDERPGLDRKITARLIALSQSQTLVAFGSTLTGPLNALISMAVLPLAPDPSRLQIEGPEVNLPSEIMTSLGLVFHELATNAVKHGAWKENAGIVRLIWARASGGLRVEWQEAGGPKVIPPQRLGSGKKLIRYAIPNSAVDYRFLEDGIRCVIEISREGAPAK